MKETFLGDLVKEWCGDMAGEGESTSTPEMEGSGVWVLDIRPKSDLNFYDFLLIFGKIPMRISVLECPA